MKQVSPIILTPADKGYVVFVPDLKINTEGENLAAYRKANDLKTIRKNVTLPSWLNSVAEEAGINFSQILQEGLKKKLRLEDRY